MASNISVIIPARNEQKFIVRCITSLLQQDYAGDIQIIVVDGQSEDKTAGLVKEIAAQDTRVQLVTNPCQTTPFGMNLGLDHATGDIVTTVGGHWELEPDFLNEINLAFERHPNVDCVGGRIIRRVDNDLGQVIEAARGSIFGGGVSSRNDTTKPEGLTQETNIAYIWRRHVFTCVGRFDTFLTKNQDNEFNLRTLRAGFKTLYAPSIVFTYFAPTSLKKLWNQMYGYASYTPIIVVKHRRLVNKSFLIPLIGLIIWSGSLLLALTNIQLWVIPVSLLAFYVVLILVGAILTVQSNQLSYRSILTTTLIYMLIHGAVALGYFRGWLKLLNSEVFSHVRDGYEHKSVDNCT